MLFLWFPLFYDPFGVNGHVAFGLIGLIIFGLCWHDLTEDLSQYIENPEDKKKTQLAIRENFYILVWGIVLILFGGYGFVALVLRILIKWCDMLVALIYKYLRKIPGLVIGTPLALQRFGKAFHLAFLSKD